eukprot:TRINITY_DN32999_c0_g1_i1.p2 TRINITY_DN32999_c0_g1~~TRINITY_DN32999_c0_g1_i1.p2  ORF type:complete len:273 (+),score=40.37 TRINITY_DN32999_c0_g1_i1:74-820(+)
MLRRWVRPWSCGAPLSNRPAARRWASARGGLSAAAPPAGKRGEPRPARLAGGSRAAARSGGGGRQPPQSSRPGRNLPPFPREALLRILLCLVLGGSGMMKVTNFELLKSEFDCFGYPDGFQYVVGSFEIACGVLLRFPKSTGPAVCGVFALMGGALYSTVRRALVLESEARRIAEVAWGSLEAALLCGLSWAVARAYRPVSAAAAAACFACGAASGYGLHAATGRRPRAGDEWALGIGEDWLPEHRAK